MLNIICFGDSITAGSEFPVAARWTTLLQGMLDAPAPGMYMVHNKGVDGNTTAQGFDRYWSDVLPLLPGILLIQFGFNDANVRDLAVVPRVSLQEYEKNLREFHRAAAVRHSPAVFIINHTIADFTSRQGNGRSYVENFLPYNDLVRRLVSELDAPCINLPDLMVQRGIQCEDFLAEDRLHLTAAGNREYAAMVYTSLLKLGLVNRVP